MQRVIFTNTTPEHRARIRLACSIADKDPAQALKILQRGIGIEEGDGSHIMVAESLKASSGILELMGEKTMGMFYSAAAERKKADAKRAGQEPGVFDFYAPWLSE